MKDSNYLKEMNARSLWHPMAHPADSLANPPTIVTGAKGVRITDVDGHEVVDGVGGLWNVNLGFSCQPIKDAIAAQLDRLPYYSIFRGTTNDAVIQLAEELRDFFEPDGLTRAFYTSGGSDSVETALRLARQYHKVRGEAARTKFLSLKKGYHGTHFGGASVNGNANFRTQYEPLLAGCHHIPAPYTYRNPFDETDPAKLAQKCLSALEDEIAFQGAGTIAAFIMEPILGAGGVIPPHESFMPGVREICSKHGILLIADEVITAFGRTGSWTGSRHWGVQPDLMCTAKAITNGAIPMGAVAVTDEIYDTATNASPEGAIEFFHGYTYSGHPLASAAGLATLDLYAREGLFERANELAGYWEDAAHSLKGRRHIIDIRTIGLVAGIELEPRPGAPTARAMELFHAAFDSGLLVRATGDIIALSPPLIVEKAEIDAMFGQLAELLDRID